MLRYLFAVILLLMSTAALAKENIVVLGDSISAGYGIEVGQGWVALVQKKLIAANACCTMVNESISGDTSAGGLARIDRILTVHRPKILLLELGANDGLRGLPPAQLKNNLMEIVRRAQNSGSQVILLSMRIPPSYGKRYVEMFYSVYPQIAKELNISSIPFIMEDIALVRDLMQADGLHPNAKAQPIIADKVWHQLQPSIQ